AGLDPVTGKPCVTMEYCRGTNLELHVAQQGPLAAGQATRAMYQLARVLDDFHTAARPDLPFGVVHRDIKPANVLLSRMPDGGIELVLIDLEHVIPRADPAREEAPTSMEFTGGTHGYSPPESYLGTYPHPGFDVFGLGATFYFLLTGS